MTSCLRLVLFAPLLLCGCVPFPNEHSFAPAVSGVVMRDGSPVAGATVSVSAQFSHQIRIATTDHDGRFATEAIREWRMTALLYGDPLFGYTVQISANGTNYAGYSLLGMGTAPLAVRLNCDVAKPVILARTQIYCNAS